MRITALIENTTCRTDLAAEHGLSLLIEANGRTVLFDAGQSGAVVANAGLLGIDLATVDTAILSHGHYDHANGFPAFLLANSVAPVYAHAGYDLPHVHGEKNIGVCPELVGSGRVRVVDGPLDLGDGLSLVSYASETPMTPIDSDGLEEDAGDGRRPERFLHEQYLIVREGDTCLLVSGCSHRGITNIMHWSAGESVTHVIGGFQLMRTATESERIEGTALELLRFPASYYTCHCTGAEQYARLKELMGERLGYLCTGDTIEL